MLPTEDQKVDLLLQQHTDIASLDLGVNTTTPETVGESKILIILNSFSKVTSVATTAIAGIANTLLVFIMLIFMTRCWFTQHLSYPMTFSPAFLFIFS